MSHTYYSLSYHVVFSTKERAQLLDKELRGQTIAYITGILRNLEVTPLSMNGVEDHLHLLIGARPRHNLADILEKTKSQSSAWLRGERGVRTFRWQKGYSAFSVSRSMIGRVTRYIELQEEHHRKTSFEDELRKLLDSHGIGYDERFLLG